MVGGGEGGVGILGLLGRPRFLWSWTICGAGSLTFKTSPTIPSDSEESIT